ncbi:cobalt-precorrin-6A reductase [Phytoactinopolyspora limicola]|uniref:cobalt-precorrin-6A reductase n=1 Tax=Phytoactinopolyspora limicola TaxID=2715536 RepID=UPI001FE4C427|nr:cobalt-precorrin-6A reductase [Phytoactinopolyspora limicola]
MSAPDGDPGGPVLVLGGTAEGREVAAELNVLGMRVVSSLAGRVSKPRLPVGEVRVGGFGGVDGLAEWLREQRAAAVVDATHPFAERISASAVTAAEQAGVPHLRLERPGWQAGPGDEWHWADSLTHAAELIARLGRRVFLTTGRQGLAAFARLDKQWFLIRCVDMPEPPMPLESLVVLDRGPYTVDKELTLMRRHRIDLLVTKDSGGTMTTAKLTAARRLGRPVVVVRRPPHPAADRVVETPAAAVRWVLEATGR